MAFNYIHMILQRGLHLFFIIASTAFLACCGIAEEKENGNGGGIPDPVDSEPGWFGFPAWHPDGLWIATEHSVAFDTDNDGLPDSLVRTGIWLVDAETGEVQDTALLEWGGAPEWSPDGSRLVVHHNAQIYTVRVNSLNPPEIDTAGIRQLTNEGRNFYPDWSPDGEWIFYDSNLDSPTGLNFIWKMRPDGSKKVRIAFAPDDGEIRIPSWSPNSQNIIHIRYLVGVYSSEIYSMKNDGSNSVRLTENEKTDRYPKYSPDGSSIASLSVPSPPEPAIAAIWIMDSTGSNQRKISPDWSGVFSWSPDGSRIVFLTYNPNEAIEGNGQLWLMDSDGKNLKQLTYFNPHDLK